MVLQVLVTHHHLWGVFSEGPSPKECELMPTIINTTLSFSMWLAQRPTLTSEIWFQDGSPSFLTDGCSAFIYYSSAEMTVPQKKLP